MVYTARERCRRAHLRLGVLLVTLVGGCSTMKYARSDHCDGTTFFNTDPNARDLKSLASVVKWRLTSKAAAWPETLPDNQVPDVSTPPADGSVRITMVNHATLLVQMPGLTVLTDPVLSDRASPVSFAGPKRARLPGIPLDRLPPIDVVVISHNHYDHLDLLTLQALQQRGPLRLLVPLGTAALLQRAGLTDVTELDWWQQAEPLPGAHVILTEAQHWSARGLFDRNHALWGGYVLGSAGMQVFFAGDTGYGAHFERIRARLGRIDVALLPIGAYEPRWFMQTQHMNPDDAVRAHRDLEAQQSIGIHFGTFQLTDEAIDAPIEALTQAKSAYGVPEGEFVPLLNGESLLYRRAP